MIKRLIQAVLLGAVLGLTTYAAVGWRDGQRDGAAMAARADALIAGGRSGADLGPRLDWLLAVEDPRFWEHNGIDLRTPGAGITTITQALAKHTGFDAFRPGIGTLRQSAYAIGLEQVLTKDQILALFLDEVVMRAATQGRIVGVFAASVQVFGGPPAAVSDNEFAYMIAVMISPARLSLVHPDHESEERVARILRLVAGDCAPAGLMDVWLKGCAAPEH